MTDLLRPIIGIEYRTPLEVFDMMCDRIKIAQRKRLADKVMTREEYDALNIQGWHSVNHTVEPGSTHLMYGPMEGPPSASQETGWLIESYGSKHNIYRAEWLTADVYTHADNRDYWTKDASRALRFARKADADAVIAALGWTEARATEHQWSAALAVKEEGE